MTRRCWRLIASVCHHSYQHHCHSPLTPPLRCNHNGTPYTTHTRPLFTAAHHRTPPHTRRKRTDPLRAATRLAHAATRLVPVKVREKASAVWPDGKLPAKKKRKVIDQLQVNHKHVAVFFFFAFSDHKQIYGRKIDGTIVGFHAEDHPVRARLAKQHLGGQERGEERGGGGSNPRSTKGSRQPLATPHNGGRALP